MVRQIPNMLSILRIILAGLLLPFMLVPTCFTVIYIAVGTTDVLDGLIARRFGYESVFGAKLDSAADFVFYCILVFIFLRLYSSLLEPANVVALAAIISIRLFNMLFTKLKYKKVVFVHTYANKASGAVIFLMPLVFLVVKNSITVWIILIIVFIAAVEELLISIKYSEPELNRKSIFFK